MLLERFENGSRTVRSFFFHKIRAGNEEAVVLFFCLDTYPSLAVVEKLDVDAFLTNSRVLLPQLQTVSHSD